MRSILALTLAATLSHPRFFLAANTGAEGGGNLTIKQQLDNANARITELELKAQKADELETKVTELNGKITGLETEKVQLSQKVTDTETKVTELNGKITGLETEKAQLSQKVTEVEGAKTKVETEFREAKEIHARSGDPLPAKQAGAGDHTQEKQNADATPRERLRSTIKVAQ